jgi:hypothetical protein
MSSYRFKEPSPREPGSGAILPEGDYEFRVTSADEPYENRNNNLVLPLTLDVEGHKIFANPWTGTTQKGNDRDGIAEFLLCVNRAPAQGAEPDWKSLVGARGHCRLKVEIASQGMLAGKERNVVAWFHAPRQVDKDYHKAQASFKAKAQEPDLGKEPDDIPF